MSLSGITESSPAITTPAITTPAITTPVIGRPVILIPAVTTPMITTPAVTTPVITTPALVVPPMQIRIPTPPSRVNLNFNPANLAAVPGVYRGNSTPVISIGVPVQISIPQLEEQLEPEPLVLREWQREWFTKAGDILRTKFGYMDTSKTGSGKSFILMALALEFKMRLIIVCPVIMEDVWIEMAETYGVPLVVNPISWASLRGSKGHTLNHPLLERIDTVTPAGNKVVRFVPSKTYLDLLKNESVLVVADEVQNAKNNTSAQSKALEALLHPIVMGGGNSRFALLSAIPLDKEEHANCILRIIGFIRAERLYRVDNKTKQLVLEGLEELLDACRRIDPTRTAELISEIGVNKKSMRHLVFMLYSKIVKYSIGGACVRPQEFKDDLKNGFFRITRVENQMQLRIGIEALQEAAHYNPDTGIAESNMGAKGSLGALTLALVAIEKAKIPDMARVVDQTLRQHPSAKVAIGLNYSNENLPQLIQLLMHWNPLKMTGATKKKDRRTIRDAFNNDPSRRLLVVNTASCGVGISLHDVRGDAPRYTFVSPTYSMSIVAQYFGRFNRDSQKSVHKGTVFYGNIGGDLESNILNALAKKTQVAKDAIDDEAAEDIQLPGDFLAEYEVGTQGEMSPQPPAAAPAV